MKSVLTFQKWTKKMSKIDLSKKSLLTEFFDLIMKFYGVILNENEKFYEHIFFIFFVEKYLGTFSTTNIWY